MTKLDSWPDSFGSELTIVAIPAYPVTTEAVRIYVVQKPGGVPPEYYQTRKEALSALLAWYNFLLSIVRDPAPTDSMMVRLTEGLEEEEDA